jgi:hypothetical protein
VEPAGRTIDEAVGVEAEVGTGAGDTGLGIYGVLGEVEAGDGL